MPISAYDATVPVFTRRLAALSAIIDGAAAHAAANKIDPAVLIGARLYPNMWAFGDQVRGVVNYVIRSTSRLAGVPIPTYPGAKETTFDELKARLAWATAHATGIDRAAFAGAEDRTIVFPSGDSERKMSGADYLLHFTYPHFYFHLTAAYAILRHNGVPIGKDDYMGD